MGVIFTFIMGLLMSFEPITDNDWFWHQVIGNYIDVHHVIPTKELFSWFGDFAWTSHEWLTEFIMYKTGPLGNLIIMSLIFIGLYFLMAKCLKLNFKKLFDFKLVFLLIMTVFFKVTGPRPYILSLLFMAYLIYVLFNYIDGKEKFNKLIYTIPVLQLLWVNFHGGSSSLSYIFIIGVLLCDVFIKIFKFKEERWCSFKLEKSQIKTLLIVLGLTIVASCINPFGIKMLAYPFTNMADDNMLDYILEWQSADFHGFFGLYIFLIIAIPLFNLILSNKKMKLHEIAFQLLLFFMCMKSQRFIGMFGIYSTWTLGKYFFVSDEMYETLRKPFKKFEKVITVGFCILLVAVTGFIGYKQIKTFKNVGVIDNDGFYSDEAILKLKELKPERMFNDYGQGGYLLYKLNEFNMLDEVKPFGYGLGDVFSSNLLPDSKKLQDLKCDPREILDKYNFDVILTVKSNALHYYLEEANDYKLYYKDDMCYIFVKEVVSE